MKIEEIKNPQFLKKMNNQQLEAVAQDIRDFIIDKLSITGGHLSSNLGVVELTIALHKVFNSPQDKIIFDVSHQAYTHKILTGRAKNFDKLRQYHGLSGFQKRKESIHDPYEAGHSSTALSAGIGLAIARDIHHDNYNVISIIGDGSLSNGLPYEALNHIGSCDSKLIIILNDNEMSISKNVGGLHNCLDKIRAGYNYDHAKKSTKKLLNKFYIGKKFTTSIKRIKSSIKKLYLKDGFIFEELGVKYYGPINGHDFSELQAYLELAKQEKKSVLIHVITRKGAGYSYSENDNLGIWHGVGPFNKKTGQVIKKDTSLISWSEIVSNHLIKLAKQNKDIVAITPAMTNGSKLNKFASLYPKRFFDVGIAEEHATILANSLAIGGLKPFLSIYSSFLQRAYDQINHDIARMNSNVVIGIDRSGLVGADGETHQGIYDISILLAIPNLIIMAPSTSKQALDMLYTAFKSSGPVAIRYSKESIAYNPKDNYELLKIGKWSMLTQGSDLMLITYGDFVHNSMNIYKTLQKEKINISVINACYIKPIDYELYESLLQKNRPIIVYEPATTINSLGSYLCLYATNHGYNRDITVLGIKDEFIEQGSVNELYKDLKLDEDSVIEIIKNKTKSYAR